MEVITTSSRRLGARAGCRSASTSPRVARRSVRLRRSEEQLRQSQKMEAIGAFAGGIAHDFNNLLTGMLGYCDLALDALPSDARGSRRRRGDPRARAARRRPHAADPGGQPQAGRAADGVRPERRWCGTSTACSRRVVGEHITVSHERDASLGLIVADAGQLEQVLLNLVANARDAMPSGGTLTHRNAQRVARPDASQYGLRRTRLVLRSPCATPASA